MCSTVNGNDFYSVAYADIDECMCILREYLSNENSYMVISDSTSGASLKSSEKSSDCYASGSDSEVLYDDGNFTKNECDKEEGYLTPVDTCGIENELYFQLSDDDVFRRQESQETEESHYAEISARERDDDYIFESLSSLDAASSDESYYETSIKMKTKGVFKDIKKRFKKYREVKNRKVFRVSESDDAFVIAIKIANALTPHMKKKSSIMVEVNIL